MSIKLEFRSLTTKPSISGGRRVDVMFELDSDMIESELVVDVPYQDSVQGMVDEAREQIYLFAVHFANLAKQRPPLS